MEAPPGMVGVAAGPFLMGSDSAEVDESPMRVVHLDGFYIDEHEVTVSQYASCVDAGECDRPTRTHGDDGDYYNYGAKDSGRHPVNGVSWFQAVAYCKWKGKRLPREAEWEKAARGVDGRTFPWGGDAAGCSEAVMDDGADGCGRDSTWEVGSKPAGASPYGALDMAGNVWEWTADWYAKDYYASGPEKNPGGPLSGSRRAVRGGCWSDRAAYLRTAQRTYDAPGLVRSDLGFRCAMTP
jgi:formylglycine-generating enzyme required for sulfatase activity